MDFCINNLPDSAGVFLETVFPSNQSNKKQWEEHTQKKQKIDTIHYKTTITVIMNRIRFKSNVTNGKNNVLWTTIKEIIRL